MMVSCCDGVVLCRCNGAAVRRKVKHEGVALWRYGAVALCICGAVRFSCRGGVTL